MSKQIPIDELRACAEAGEAQYFWACCYYDYGDGVVKDKGETVRWYRAAAAALPGMMLAGSTAAG